MENASVPLSRETMEGTFLRLVQSNTPFVNLFYTKAAIDYLVFYQLQEMANLGYLRRMDRRIKRENNLR